MRDGTYMASIYRLEAVNFWEAAKTLAGSFTTPPDQTPASIVAIPFYLLISHAVELLLKSALFKRGFTEDQLKTFGYRHNLSGLLEALQSKGVQVTPISERVIGGLHSQHLNHALRYTALVDDGQETYMPPPSVVFGVLEELLLLTRLATQGV